MDGEEKEEESPSRHGEFMEEEEERSVPSPDLFGERRARGTGGEESPHRPLPTSFPSDDEDSRDSRPPPSKRGRIDLSEDELTRMWEGEGPSTSRDSARGDGASEGSRGKDVGWMMEGRGDENGMLKNFGHYMRLKKDKLLHQVNILGKQDSVSDIFKGVSIFVNGYTEPSSLELRALIQAHGGEFHVYFEYGKTTYSVASDMASVKRSKTRQNERIVRPELFVDSVAAGALLDDRPYLLLPDEEEERRRKGGTISQIIKNNHQPQPQTVDARNAGFIDEYYARSRLHLISTLAQEMRDYVSTIRERDAAMDFGPIRDKMLKEIAGKEADLGPLLPASERAVFHVDLDCFFVSVALRSRPDLRGKAVAVTHSSGNRNSHGFSEVASCSYAARANGVKNGSLVRDALKKCPDLVCVPYQFDEYRVVSKSIYDVVASLTLDLRAVSCDEMYVEGGELCRGASPATVANHMRQMIRSVTGCPASVGIGPNPLIARLATRLAKPDGARWIPEGRVAQFMATQKIADLPGVGYSTLEKLAEGGCRMETCGELQTLDEATLQRLVGKKGGSMLFHLCRGIDDSAVVTERVRKSISCDINYGIRFTKEEELDQFLASLASQLEKKLEAARMVAASITIKIMVRSADAPVQTAKYLGHGRCDTHTKSARMEPPIADAPRLLLETRNLMKTITAPLEDLRGIGVQLTRLLPSDGSIPVAGRIDGHFKKKGDVIGEETSEEAEQRRLLGDFDIEEELDADSRLHANSKLRARDLITEQEFFGACQPADVAARLREIVRYRPNRRVVRSLQMHVLGLVRRGELPQIRAFTNALEVASCGARAALDWRTASRTVIRHMEQLCKAKYRAVPNFLNRGLRLKMNEFVQKGTFDLEDDDEALQ